MSKAKPSNLSDITSEQLLNFQRSLPDEMSLPEIIALICCMLRAYDISVDDALSLLLKTAEVYASTTPELEADEVELQIIN